MKKSTALLFVLAAAFAQTSKAQTEPPPPPPPIELHEHQPVDKGFDAFLQRNPNIENVHWKKNNVIVIKLKNGNTQTFNLNKKESLQKFTNTYGMPPLPPPPPPAPPLPPPPPPPPVINQS
jgi:hypothetical protein